MTCVCSPRLMSELTKFLLARVAEDEAAATNVAVLRYDPERHLPAYQAITARVLAECEAKRRIVERREGIDIPADAKCPPGEGFTWLDGAHTAVRNERERTFRLLAEVYATHPDYRPEWRP